MKHGFKRARFWMLVLVLTGAIAAGAFEAWRLRNTQPSSRLAAAPARQGEFLVIIRCRGELRARRSAAIAAPVGVPSLRIMWQAPPGSPVKQGDPVVRFDTSAARQQLQEKEAALKQAQATLDQALAQARTTAQQDRRDLAGSRYELERARLETSKAEILNRLQGEENMIDFGLAKQNLAVAEATVDLHQASDKAKTASLARQLEKARSEVALVNNRIAQMEIKAPLAGLIVYLPNYSQGYFNARPFKVGDQVWPGAALAELPDIDTLEMSARVEEVDRGRMGAGAEARVRVDSLPELTIPARLASLSLLSELDLAQYPPTRSFLGFARLEQSDPRLRPGMNGSLDVVVSRLPGAISVPAKALFTRDGKPVVYAVAGNRYRPRPVEVLARNPDEVAVKGIPAQTMVALTEPEQKDLQP